MHIWLGLQWAAELQVSVSTGKSGSRPGLSVIRFPGVTKDWLCLSSKNLSFCKKRGNVSCGGRGLAPAWRPLSLSLPWCPYLLHESVWEPKPWPRSSRSFEISEELDTLAASLSWCPNSSRINPPKSSFLEILSMQSKAADLAKTYEALRARKLRAVCRGHRCQQVWSCPDAASQAPVVRHMAPGTDQALGIRLLHLGDSLTPRMEGKSVSPPPGRPPLSSHEQCFTKFSRSSMSQSRCPHTPHPWRKCFIPSLRWPALSLIPWTSKGNLLPSGKMENGIASHKYGG